MTNFEKLCRAVARKRNQLWEIQLDIWNQHLKLDLPCEFHRNPRQKVCRQFLSQAKKLQVSDWSLVKKLKMFKKSSETLGSIHNFVPHQKLSNFGRGGG